MSAITVRRLPDGMQQMLRNRAAANGRSVEAEIREILLATLQDDRRVDLEWVDGLLAIGTHAGADAEPDDDTVVP